MRARGTYTQLLALGEIESQQSERNHE